MSPSAHRGTAVPDLQMRPERSLSLLAECRLGLVQPDFSSSPKTTADSFLGLFPWESEQTPLGIGMVDPLGVGRLEVQGFIMCSVY